MGRPSKLTDKQWQQIGKRLLAGEKARPLAREFGVSEAAIRGKFSAHMEKVKSVANQIVATREQLDSMPVSAQIDAFNLADKLRSISSHMAGAAVFSAASAHRLMGMAHEQVQKIDDAEPERTMVAMQRFGALNKLANEAAHIPLNLLSANKESVKLVNQDTPVTPVRIVVQVEDASLPEAQ